MPASDKSDSPSAVHEHIRRKRGQSGNTLPTSVHSKRRIVRHVRIRVVPLSAWCVRRNRVRRDEAPDRRVQVSRPQVRQPRLGVGLLASSVTTSSRLARSGIPRALQELVAYVRGLCARNRRWSAAPYDFIAKERLVNLKVDMFVDILLARQRVP